MTIRTTRKRTLQLADLSAAFRYYPLDILQKVHAGNTIKGDTSEFDLFNLNLVYHDDTLDFEADISAYHHTIRKELDRSEDLDGCRPVRITSYETADAIFDARRTPTRIGFLATFDSLSPPQKAAITTAHEKAYLQMIGKQKDALRDLIKPQASDGLGLLRHWIKEEGFGYRWGLLPEDTPCLKILKRVDDSQLGLWHFETPWILAWDSEAAGNNGNFQVYKQITYPTWSKLMSGEFLEAPKHLPEGRQYITPVDPSQPDGFDIIKSLII